MASLNQLAAAILNARALPAVRPGVINARALPTVVGGGRAIPSYAPGQLVPGNIIQGRALPKVQSTTNVPPWGVTYPAGMQRPSLPTGQIVGGGPHFGSLSGNFGQGRMLPGPVRRTGVPAGAWPGVNPGGRRLPGPTYRAPLPRGVIV